MSKEVKRYDPLAGLARNAKLRRMEMQCDPQWVLDLLAERDAAQKDAERYRWIKECDPEEIDIVIENPGDHLDAAIDAALQGEQP